MADVEKDYGEYEFPMCMHKLAAAMHIQGIDPSSITIQIPFSDWWKLQCALERKMRGFMLYAGKGAIAEEFQYMGFRFTAKKGQ